MKNPDRPDAPENPMGEKPSLESRFAHLLIDTSPSPPNEYILDVFARDRDVRDIYTHIVFEDDGTLVFKVVDDVCRYGDNFGSKPFYDVTLFIIEAERRNEIFEAFLESVPEDEDERRAALVPVLKAALKPSYMRPLLESKGIDWQPLYKAVYI